jgi:hypothetical protein
MAVEKSEEKAVVYFADLRASLQDNLIDKLGRLLTSVGIDEKFGKGTLVAVKVHFGEKGNTAYIPPVFVRSVVERIKATGAEPFLTDTNTLYVGTRTNSVVHIATAIENGFAYAVVNAPIIIADGLRGNDGVAVEVEGGQYYKEVQIAREIVNADAMVVLTHFKCHEMSGFGGALKNVGMGCASREGKLAQHSNCAPVVEPKECFACGACVTVCPAEAIEIEAVAFIDDAKCIGCGHCIPACPEGAIKISWDETTTGLQKKMVEHAQGALRNKEGRTVYVNFIQRISPSCDCYGHTDAPIAPDVGIVASTDPVAIDAASAELVNRGAGFAGTALKSGMEPGGDKFRGVYPEVDWEVQLKGAERLGLGTRKYRLETV